MVNEAFAEFLHQGYLFANLRQELPYQGNLSTQDYVDYDKEVEHYYLSRTSNPRKENFTQQIIGKNSNLNRKVTKRDEVLELTHSKGMLWN